MYVYYFSDEIHETEGSLMDSKEGALLDAIYQAYAGNNIDKREAQDYQEKVFKGIEIQEIEHKMEDFQIYIVKRQVFKKEDYFLV